MRQMVLIAGLLVMVGCDKTIHEVRAPLPDYGRAVVVGTGNIGTPTVRSRTSRSIAATNIDTTLTMKPILNQ